MNGPSSSPVTLPSARQRCFRCACGGGPNDSPCRFMRALSSLVLSLLVAAAAPASVAAQAPQRTDTVRDTARIAPVVVTATSIPVALDRVPASVTVLDGAALRAEGLTHIADALRQVPGVAGVQSGSLRAPAAPFPPGGPGHHPQGVGGRRSGDQ